MLIKFKAPDPRAGTVARLDSSRARQLVDAGAAVPVNEGVQAEPAPQAPPPKPMRTAAKKAR